MAVPATTAVSTLCEISFCHCKDVGTPKIEVVDALPGRYIVGLVSNRFGWFLVCWDEGTIFGGCFIAGSGRGLFSWYKRCGFGWSVTGSYGRLLSWSDGNCRIFRTCNWLRLRHDYCAFNECGIGWLIDHCWSVLADYGSGCI
jgi:hypothetical protein